MLCAVPVNDNNFGERTALVYKMNSGRKRVVVYIPTHSLLSDDNCYQTIRI